MVLHTESEWIFAQANLLDNAIKYSSGPCAILVELSAYDAQYMITVADAGLGIPPHVATRIFERFYRGDSSRSSSPRAMENGAGLGLPIARWIAESHRGRLELLSSDHTGTTFGVFLPRD